MTKKKKEKNKSIFKTILLIFIITFVIWGLYSITDLIIKPTNIFVVNNGEVYSEESSVGYIIREETIIPSSEEKQITQIKTEGEKVAKGEVVYKYSSSEEDNLNKEIQELSAKIQEALEGQVNLFSSDIKALENQIEARLQGINEKNNIQNIKEYKNDISTYITKKAKIAGGLSTSETYINSLISQKEELEAQLNSKAEYIYAPISGVVSYRLDDFEDKFPTDDFSYITQNYLDEMNLKTGQVINSSNIRAKIVNNYKCYVATILKSEEAQNIKENKSLNIRLSNNDSISGKVKYKRSEGKKTIIVFEINDNVDKLMEYRKISIDVIWWEVDGLKIPKNAIYYDNGFAYVKRNRAGYIENILVKVLEENDDYCIVGNYTSDELKKNGFSAGEIQNNKKINLYDEIILNPNK